MKIEKIKNILKKNIDFYKIKIRKENDNIEIVAISNIFINKTDLQRQQIIYKSIYNLIIKKKIHAVTIYTYSIKEWKKINNLK
ncbi:BolA/IbaG family iron-sulfur metabolism protein [Buchnera aphidicola (Ceratovacuna keduensis)]|uniref:BolA/IbaG family iron-sulfur metabolism protein n=1 Tax=Buchnera aphidicola TaxID=9 RepID=UPI0031B81A01